MTKMLSQFVDFLGAHQMLAIMAADTAPADLRCTAYGFFNLVAGVRS